MNVIRIDTIHGDHFVRAAAGHAMEASALYDPLALAAREKATSVRLTSVNGRSIYVIEGPSGERAFSATSAAPPEPPDEHVIKALAASYYVGSEPIVGTELITAMPGEIRGRTPPLWRVEFDHWNRLTFYLSPVTG